MSPNSLSPLSYPPHPPSLPPQPQAAIHLLSVWVSLLWTFHRRAMIPHGASCVWPLGLVFSWFIRAMARISGLRPSLELCPFP